MCMCMSLCILCMCIVHMLLNLSTLLVVNKPKILLSLANSKSQQWLTQSILLQQSFQGWAVSDQQNPNPLHQRISLQQSLQCDLKPAETRADNALLWTDHNLRYPCLPACSEQMCSTSPKSLQRTISNVGRFCFWSWGKLMLPDLPLPAALPPSDLTPLTPAIKHLKEQT